MKVARLSWFKRQLDLDPDRLAFLDETATNTKMARRYLSPLQFEEQHARQTAKIAA